MIFEIIIGLIGGLVVALVDTVFNIIAWLPSVLGFDARGVVLEPAYQDWLIPSIRLLPYVMGVYGVAALLSVMYAYLTLVTVRMVMSGFRVVAGWIEFFKV